MLVYVARRVLFSIPVIVLSSFLSFTFVSLAGDPTANIRAAPNYSAVTLHSLQHEYHLDRPIPIRFGRASSRGSRAPRLAGHPRPAGRTSSARGAPPPR